MNKAAYADVDLVTGDPQNTNVIDTYEIAIDGVSKKVEVGIMEGDDAIDKATNLTRNINRIFGAGTAVQNTDDAGLPLPSVRIKGKKVSTRLRSKNNKSKQTTGSGQVSFIPSDDEIDFRGSFDLDGILDGFDDNGLEAVYNASFGFDGFVADSNLTFSGLSGSTTNDLLEDMFDQFLLDLPESLKPNLTLNLATQSIFFDFPVGEQGYFVFHSTTDTQLSEGSGLLVSVPEPGNILGLLVISGLGLSLKRRISF